MKWKEENEEKIFLFSFSFHFSKPLKLVLGLPKWKFSTGKKISRWEKNQENDFASSLRLWLTRSFLLLNHHRVHLSAMLYLALFKEPAL